MNWNIKAKGFLRWLYNKYKGRKTWVIEMWFASFLFEGKFECESKKRYLVKPLKSELHKFFTK